MSTTSKKFYVEADSAYAAIRKHFPYINNYYIDAGRMLECKTFTDLKDMLDNDRTDAREVFEQIEGYLNEEVYPDAVREACELHNKPVNFDNLVAYYMYAYYAKNIALMIKDELMPDVKFVEGMEEEFVELENLQDMDLPSKYIKWCVQLNEQFGFITGMVDRDLLNKHMSLSRYTFESLMKVANTEH